MTEFYDIVDSEGNVVETAEEQRLAAAVKPVVDSLMVNVDETLNKIEAEDIPLTREQPKLSEGEIKKLRKQYITVQHPRVVGCQHRLDLSRQPRHRNCQTCWFAWFNNHGEIVQQLDEMHVAEGDKLIVQLQGNKFLHRWRQFMATVASWKKVGEVGNDTRTQS